MAPKTAGGGRKIPQGDLAELERAGLAVLPNTVPEWGTAGRMALSLASAPTAYGLGWPKVAAAMGTSHLAYSPWGTRYISGNIGRGWSEGVRNLEQGANALRGPSIMAAALRGWRPDDKLNPRR